MFVPVGLGVIRFIRVHSGVPNGCWVHSRSFGSFWCVYRGHSGSFRDHWIHSFSFRCA